MQSSVKLEGMEEVFKNLHKYGKKVKQANEVAVKRGSEVILHKAWDNIGKGDPYPEWITGELENSIKAKVDGVGETYAVAHIGTLEATKEQAIIANSVEYGHAFPYQGRDRNKKKHAENKATGNRVKAYPFMRPAIKSTKQKAAKIYKEELQKIFGGDNERS
jgi:HK97 gp10 family phage protein